MTSNFNFPDPPPDAVAHLPRYAEWLFLRTHGMWSGGVPSWARDHDGKINDAAANRAVMEELAVFAFEENHRLREQAQELSQKLSTLQETLSGTSVNLPPYVYGRECGENEKVWTEASLRQFVARIQAQQAHLARGVDADGTPFVVRLAEDFADACILKGYVSTSDPTHEKLVNEAKALTAGFPNSRESGS